MAFVDKVYPFTTESISGYIKHMDVKDKRVLTVGSSMDQALNACLYGSKDVMVMDINEGTKDYMQYKLHLLNESDTRRDFYDAISNTKEFNLSKDEMFSFEALKRMSPYMASEDSFTLLKNNIKETSFDFIPGNIYDMDGVLGDRQYDRIILSNVLQYINSCRGNIPIYQFIKDNFDQFCNHLSKDGILQLMYIYAFEKNNHFEGYSTIDVLRALEGNILEIVKFESGSKEDAAILYTKK